MQEFTFEMLHKLRNAYIETCGTPEYTKYLMQYDYKEGKKWHFCTHTIPQQTGIIKTFKDKTYIICDGLECNGRIIEGYRYHVTPEVKELLGI